VCTAALVHHVVPHVQQLVVELLQGLRRECDVRLRPQQGNAQQEVQGQHKVQGQQQGQHTVNTSPILQA
jgi:hypothetical protein